MTVTVTGGAGSGTTVEPAGIENEIETVKTTGGGGLAIGHLMSCVGQRVQEVCEKLFRHKKKKKKKKKKLRTASHRGEGRRG